MKKKPISKIDSISKYGASATLSKIDGNVGFVSSLERGQHLIPPGEYVHIATTPCIVIVKDISRGLTTRLLLTTDENLIGVAGDSNNISTSESTTRLHIYINGRNVFVKNNYSTARSIETTVFNI